jgi:signal transduction histidine kinase/CheY-like chemotaxis protein
MKTLLVLAPHPDLAEAMQAGLHPEQYRVIHRVSPEEAEPLLVHGLADVCVLDLELSGAQGIWVIEKLRRKTTRCPIIVYAGARQADWEEEAYLQGVRHVLSKPFRARLLTTVLEGLSPAPVTPPAPARPVETSFYSGQEAPRGTTTAASTTFHSLEVLRDFSAILTHSLKADALLKEFLLMIREITGVNRSAIFLRPPTAPFLSGTGGTETRQMAAACAIGLSSNLLDNVQLSFDTGIGSHVQRLGRILRRGSPDAADVETQREFELLGAQVAVPILDRERLLGVAVFDARVTGEPLVNAELELIFHLLEQVGLAVKNIWLHDQVASNHSILADVMRELSSACVVVSRDLMVLHANRMARKYFGQTGSRSGELEFSDLPATLGSKVFQVLKTGSALAPFRYTPEDEPGTVYQVTISPVHQTNAPVPSSALLIVEDRTQAEQLQKLEVESAKFARERERLQLVNDMARRLGAEIGNSITTVDVHQQLMSSRWKEPDFRDNMDKALADAVKRINRLVNQMRYLAGNVCSTGESKPLSSLVDEAYEEARKYQGGRSSKLKNECREKPVVLGGDPSALKYAFFEIILNAMQSNPASPQVVVRCRDEAPSNGSHEINIEVEDNGGGFTPEAQQKAGTPFFTTRIPGVGLGLPVARKILEDHNGKLVVPPPQPGLPGVVRMSLPAETAIPKS